MPVMESVTVENFRCFGDSQTVALAPLTLLVGENSTGKTSFLAVLRLLAGLAAARFEPDFKDPPYDLGSFDEISHSRGGRAGRAQQFTIGFSTFRQGQQRRRKRQVSQRYTFAKRGTVPALIARHTESERVSIDEEVHTDGTYSAHICRNENHWYLSSPGSRGSPISLADYSFRVRRALVNSEGVPDGHEGTYFVPQEGGPLLSHRDIADFRSLYSNIDLRFASLPYASAPVRSMPLRTYNPARTDQNPEGEHVPMYLADLKRRSNDEWKLLQKRLEDFGVKSGLFDELEIRLLGRSGSDPFQVQIRKGGGRLRGPRRNLTDVGYGVSQALPVVTELLRSDATSQHLLQQPEVHLHPRAQAALGTLLGDLAASGKQLIVETHSDHLIDRVRMEVRDGTTTLKPEDVLILYFERNELDVKIYEIRFDELGNVCGAPETYRNFFMEETQRSLGL